jgi:hypothetical protein
MPMIQRQRLLYPTVRAGFLARMAHRRMLHGEMGAPVF